MLSAFFRELREKKKQAKIMRDLLLTESCENIKIKS